MKAIGLDMAVILQFSDKLSPTPVDAGELAASIEKAKKERAEIGRRADSHRPAEAGVIRRDQIMGVGERIEPARTLIVEGATEIRHPERTRRALDETHAKSILKIPNHFTHARRR